MDTNVSTVAEFGKLAELSYLDYEQDILIKGTTFSEFKNNWGQSKIKLFSMI